MDMVEMTKGAVHAVLEDLYNMQMNAVGSFDAFFGEKMNWISQVREDIKNSKGKAPPLFPKTPSAARAARRKRLSTIEEKDGISSKETRKRSVRKASKRIVSSRLKWQSGDSALSEEEDPEVNQSVNVDIVRSIRNTLAKENSITRTSSVNNTDISPNDKNSIPSNDAGDGSPLVSIQPVPCFNSTMVLQKASYSSDILSPSAHDKLDSPTILKFNCTYDVLKRDSDDIILSNLKSDLATTCNITQHAKSIDSTQEEFFSLNVSHAHEQEARSSDAPVIESIIPEENQTFDEIVEEPVIGNSVDHSKIVEEPVIGNSVDHSKTVEEPVIENTVDCSKTVEEPVIENSVDCSKTVEEPVIGNSAEHSKTVEEPVTEASIHQENEEGEASVTEDSVYQENERVETPVTENLIHQESAAPCLNIVRTPKLKKSPAVFSAYGSESVKKRVAAYEKLKQVAAQPEAPATRMTRTKTRAIAAAAAAAVDKETFSKSTKQKQLKNEKELLRKLARTSIIHAKSTLLKTSAKKKNLDESSKENSVILSSTKSTLSSSIKKNPKAPYTTPRILGDVNNITSGSVQGNKYASKPGIIVTNVQSFITKAPAKPRPEEIERKKEEERKKREEKEMEANRKREELLREKAEMQKRKREEKLQRVHQAREAQEKEKKEQQRKFCEEKNERVNYILQEQEAKLKEETTKKKQQHQQKFAEVEERRRLEEAARIAKLKEQEEEQKRIQALRKKEHEEAELLRQKRLAQEKDTALRVEQTVKAGTTKVKENQAKILKQAEVKVKAAKEIPTPLALPKSADDYGIDDVNSDEPSDSEDRPKKIIPLWAQKSSRLSQIKLQESVDQKLLTEFISCRGLTPDLTKMFTNINKKYLVRTSSAIWRTPPRCSQMPS